jgi:hypothetical protein
MLSVEECKKHFKSSHVDDETVARIRDSLYQAAQVLVGEFLKKGSLKNDECGHLLQGIQQRTS